MSFLAPKLNHRIEIQKAVFDKDTPNLSGGFDRDYETLTTIWAGIKEVRIFSDYAAIIRGEATGSEESHEFIVRMSAVENLGAAFTKGYSEGFDSIADLNPLKSDYFIFLKVGSSVKGRRFQILRLRRDEVHREFLLFRCTEIEEVGTGHPA